MLDAKFNIRIIIVEIIITLAGVLFWFSSSFANNLGVSGFFTRLFAGIVCFIITIVLHFVGTRG